MPDEKHQALQKKALRCSHAVSPPAKTGLDGGWLLRLSSNRLLGVCRLEFCHLLYFMLPSMLALIPRLRY